MDEKIINYNFFHWGPFLYKTKINKNELNKIKKICSKKSENCRDSLAGLIKHEHIVDVKKMFPIIFPYLQSYSRAYKDHYNQVIGNKIELVSSWVNYMTKGECNPLHSHEKDLSFIIYTHVPKELEKEIKDSIGKTDPGVINFIYSLNKDKHTINTHRFLPEIGDFFIFPSSLHHYVNPFTCKGERISISGNIKIIND